MAPRRSTARDHGERGPPRRQHALLPHTADAGLSASAPKLAALFEETAAALGELSAKVEPGADPTLWRDIELGDDDLVGLAYGWLNELIALIDIEHAAIVVARVGLPEDADVTGRRHLRARIGLRPHGAPGVRPLAQPKSATYHGLRVDREGRQWTLEAYVDL